MLISYSRPAITWSLIGATWLTDADALTDGRPASVARVQAAGAMTLRGTWASGFAPRVVALLGLTLAVGTQVKLAFRRAADAGYTYLADVYAQSVTQLPDGSRCVWFVLPSGLDPVIGVEYRIASGAGTIDIGEAWAGRTVEIVHESGWARGVIDPTSLRRSKGGQLFGRSARGWRTLQVRFAPAGQPEVNGAGLADAADWERVEAALMGGSPCVFIPRWRGQTTDYLQRTAMFGVATHQGDVQHAAGSLYGRDYVFEEVPAQQA